MSVFTAMSPHVWKAALRKPFHKGMTVLWFWTRKRVPGAGFAWMPALTMLFPLIHKKTWQRSVTFVITGWTTDSYPLVPTMFVWLTAFILETLNLFTKKIIMVMVKDIGMTSNSMLMFQYPFEDLFLLT